MVHEWDGKSVDSLLRLERLDRDLFRNRVNQPNMNGALFGGQVLAQSLMAAAATIDEDSPADRGTTRPPHSLHGYFLRSGKVAEPVLFEVDRTRDGGSFSTRRVVAIQNGTPIFHMECGFHCAEDGFEHQQPLPAGIARPDELQNLWRFAEENHERLPPWLAKLWRARQWSLEIRPLDPESLIPGHAQTTNQAVWMRIPEPHDLLSPAQEAALAWLSDYWLASTAAQLHRLSAVSPSIFMASLDHAMWFHRPVDVRQWLLFAMESPSAADGRGFARGLVYQEDGRLVASIAQEALIRRRRPD